eukprot:6824421-Lingulodinium_polyedra.AAC.1
MRRHVLHTSPVGIPGLFHVLVPDHDRPTARRARKQSAVASARAQVEGVAAGASSRSRGLPVAVWNLGFLGAPRLVTLATSTLLASPARAARPARGPQG